jgi:hypothetical protein
MVIVPQNIKSAVLPTGREDYQPLAELLSWSAGYRVPKLQRHRSQHRKQGTTTRAIAQSAA